MEIKIEDLRILCNDNTVAITQHVSHRLKERNIKFNDIKNAILTGEIIEFYPNDYPYPSCLVLGNSITDKNLHVVVGICDNFLWIITAYYPTPDKWNKDLKTRRLL